VPELQRILVLTTCSMHLRHRDGRRVGESGSCRHNFTLTAIIVGCMGAIYGRRMARRYVCCAPTRAGESVSQPVQYGIVTYVLRYRAKQRKRSSVEPSSTLSRRVRRHLAGRPRMHIVTTLRTLPASSLVSDAPASVLSNCRSASWMSSLVSPILR
jgi:hypothetical protein